MDYNSKNKGFICNVVNLLNIRATWVVFVLITCNLALMIVKYIGYELGQKALICTFIMGISALIITLNPKIFITRIAGLLAMIGSSFVCSISLKDLESSLLYIAVIFGILSFLSLISWFIYNARSEEINKL